MEWFSTFFVSALTQEEKKLSVECVSATGSAVEASDGKTAASWLPTKRMLMVGTFCGDY